MVMNSTGEEFSKEFSTSSPLLENLEKSGELRFQEFSTGSVSNSALYWCFGELGELFEGIYVMRAYSHVRALGSVRALWGHLYVYSLCQKVLQVLQIAIAALFSGPKSWRTPKKEFSTLPGKAKGATQC